MSRWFLILVALTFVLVPGSAALGDPSVKDVSPPASLSPDAPADARWEDRLDDAVLRLRKAEARYTRALSAWKHARHRQKPRGAALDALAADLNQAEQELAFAKDDLPRLREMARRDGVEPGVLRRTE